MNRKTTAGLSLLEILIAAVILVVAFIPVFNIFSRGQSDTLETEAISIVTRLGQTGADEINSLSYRELERELMIKKGTLDKTKTYKFTPSDPLGDVCKKLFSETQTIDSDPGKRPPTMLNLDTTLELSPGDGMIKATIVFNWRQKKNGTTVDREEKISTLSVNISQY